MTVEHINYSDTLRQGTDKINAAIDQSNEAIATANDAKSTADQALANSENTQTQLDTIVINGDSSVEAAQARVDTNGHAYTTLKERLDTEHGNIITQLTNYEQLMQNNHFDVKSFGAKGDGINDDAPYIQQALNQQNVLFRTTVYIPAGTYIINTMLIVPANTTIIIHPNAVLKRGAGIYAIFTNGNPTDSFTGYNGNGNITISGGTLDLDGLNIKQNGGGISFAHAENITIRDMTILNVYNTHHIELNSIKNGLVSHCKFKGYTHDGTRAFSEAVQIDLAKDSGTFPLFGDYDNTPCTVIRIENCTFDSVGCGIGSHAISPNIFHSFINVYNCTFDNCLDNGIHFLGYQNSGVYGCSGYNNLQGIYFENCYQCVMTDNRIKYSINNGVEINNSNSISGKGNIIANSAWNGITIYNGSYAINLDDTFVYGSGSHGINIEANDCIVSNSIIKQNDKHGVYIHACTNSKVHHCTISENGSHGVLLSLGASLCGVEACYVHSNNQNNNSSNNIIVVSNTGNNRIINNVCRQGSLTNKPLYGVYIGSDCNNNVVIGNDLRQGGSTANISDNAATTIKSFDNIIT